MTPKSAPTEPPANSSSCPVSNLGEGQCRLSVFRRLCFRGLKWVGGLLTLLAVVYWALPKPDLLPPDLEYSRTVLDREGKVLFLTTTSDGRLRLPVTMDQISPALMEATLEMEDRRFFSHAGVDGKSLLRAAWGVVSGQNWAAAPPSPCS